MGLYINNYGLFQMLPVLYNCASQKTFNKNHLDIPTLHYYLSRINLNGSCEFYINFYFEKLLLKFFVC